MDVSALTWVSHGQFLLEELLAMVLPASLLHQEVLGEEATLAGVHPAGVVLLDRLVGHADVFFFGARAEREARAVGFLEARRFRSTLME